MAGVGIARAQAGEAGGGAGGAAAKAEPARTAAWLRAPMRAVRSE